MAAAEEGFVFEGSAEELGGDGGPFLFMALTPSISEVKRKEEEEGGLVGRQMASSV